MPPFIHETGAPDARYAILEKSKSWWQTQLLTVPYDSRAMAQLARQRGADTWAQAIETGWFTQEE